jgi:hypothetical protein
MREVENGILLGGESLLPYQGLPPKTVAKLLIKTVLLFTLSVMKNWTSRISAGKSRKR